MKVKLFYKESKSKIYIYIYIYIYILWGGGIERRGGGS